jgi:intraflagellar transport protein 56
LCIQFERSTGTAKQPANSLWTGYAAFHLGDYQTSHDVYRDLCKKPDAEPIWFLFWSITQFYLGMYQAADENAKKGIFVHILALHNTHLPADFVITCRTYLQVAKPAPVSFISQVQ